MLSPFSPYSTKCFYNFSTSKNQTQKSQLTPTFSSTKNLFNLIPNSQIQKTPTTSISSSSRSLFNLIVKPQTPKPLGDSQTSTTEKPIDSMNTQQNQKKSNSSLQLYNKDFKYSGIENEYGEKFYYIKEDIYVARVVRGHKIYIQGGYYEQEINKEVEYIQELAKGCDNIIRYYGYVTRGLYFYMITGWGEFKLKDLLLSEKGQLDWKQKVSIACGIANALRHTHQQGKMHYDLIDQKIFIFSENILLTYNLEPMLYNFRVPGGSSSTDCLTRWSAPEVWTSKIHEPSSEVYSFSIILWELSAEKLPFDLISDEYIYKIVNKRPKPESIAGTPIVYQDLMIKGWAQNPDDRPTMDEIFKILKILKSDFKNGQDIKKVSETSYFANNLDMTFNQKVSETSSLTNKVDTELELESNVLSNEWNDDSTIVVPDFTTNATNRDDFDFNDKTPSRTLSLNSVSTVSQDHLYSAITSPKLSSKPESTTSNKPPPTLLHTLEDAISFYNERKYKKAFAIFKAHSEHNNDPIANYWVGLFYYKGHDDGKPKFKNSVKYLSEAAEKGHSDAQFLYAKLLFTGYSAERHKNNPISIGAEMLKKAADAENLDAMSYYGRLLIK
ncbi:31370_t:CDS:2, partial [Racocetra persica]